MNYVLVRSKRKTIALKIREDCQLEVRAPKQMPLDQIEIFVKKHQTWVDRHLQGVIGYQEKRAAFRVAFGQSYLMMGKTYPLIAGEKSQTGFNGNGFYLWEKLEEDQLKSEMISLYRGLARNLLIKKTIEFGRRMGVFPQKLKINKARTRWGSCSSAGNLNFSWYLIMAEESAIDYVVVHELAHLIKMNHSKEFWEIVKTYCPDYEQAKDKLKKLQETLAIQDWD
jgi:predicted metal-dependent hydrolase